MALEALHDSKYQFGFSSRVLNQVTGLNMQSSSSDYLLPEDGQYQAVVASLLNASSVNLPGSAATITQMNEDMGMGMGMISRIKNPTIVHETANFKLSRFSSLIPDGNTAISTGPRSHRSASANVYSFLNLPPLPVFSSHSFSSSVSSITEGSSTMQQTSHLGLNGSQARKRKQRGLTTTSLPDLQRRQNLALSGLNLDLCTSSELHKKPRLDILQIKSKNENQLNVLPSTPQIRGVDIEKLQQQLQMRQHQLQQVVHQAPAAYALHSGECSRRIMQYIYHLQHRPSDNGIAYWRKFVAEYYAPCAKKRWCLSLYDNVGHHALGVFPKATMDAWQCDLCGSKSGRGFEANLETLPRLNKIMFESGVIDELLYLDLPHELVLYSGLMMLEYGKAVQEIVYEQFRVVHEGKLRIIFTPDLKILSWEFCLWRHEEFLPRNLVAPQVNQLVQTAQKYQSASGSDGASPHDLQANCKMFLVAGCQLARNMELQLVDNFGFPKRYVRCLQIAEIVSNMNDLITFSLNNNSGPIESLKNYSQGTSSSKTLKHESQEEGSTQGLLNDRTKLMASLPVLDNGENDSSNFTGSGPLAALGYYERLLKQNSFTLETSKGILEPSSYNVSSASSKSSQGRKTLKSGLVQNLSVDSLSSFNSSECNQKTEECLIQKLLQEMINNSRTASSRGCSVSGVEKVNHKTTNSNVAGLPAVTRAGREIDVNSTAALKASGNPVNNSVAGKFSSFTVASSSAQPSIYGIDNSIRKEQCLPEFIQNMLGGCFDKSISDGGGCDINYPRKA